MIQVLTNDGGIEMLRQEAFTVGEKTEPGFLCVPDPLVNAVPDRLGLPYVA